MTTRRRLRPSRGHDVGAATIWMISATVIVLAVAGLVFDGGTLLAAKRDAINNAEEAARAGAQGLDIDGVLAGQGPLRLDPAAACARSDAFLAANNLIGRSSCDTTTVTVTVTRNQPMSFLGAFGIGARTVTGTARAGAHQGFAGT
jgi:Flp pilus assembly protein TadG